MTPSPHVLEALNKPLVDGLRRYVDPRAHELRRMGFEVTDSRTNFVWAHCDDVDALEWNARLRSDGILARHFTGPRTSDWLRITVGTPDQMDAFLASTAAFLVHTGNC